MQPEESSYACVVPHVALPPEGRKGSRPPFERRVAGRSREPVPLYATRAAIAIFISPSLWMRSEEGVELRVVPRFS